MFFLRHIFNSLSVRMLSVGVTAPPSGTPSGDALLKEDGDYILLENGDYLLLE